MKTVKLPAGYAPPPPVPAGYSHWVFSWGLEKSPERPWTRTYGSMGKTWCPNTGFTTGDKTSSLPFVDKTSLCAVAFKTARSMPKPRRESLAMQFATAIQRGRRNEAESALDIAHECMRILGNHQRMQRRKREAAK